MVGGDLCRDFYTYHCSNTECRVLDRTHECVHPFIYRYVPPLSHTHSQEEESRRGLQFNLMGSSDTTIRNQLIKCSSFMENIARTIKVNGSNMLSICGHGVLPLAMVGVITIIRPRLLGQILLDLPKTTKCEIRVQNLFEGIFLPIRLLTMQCKPLVNHLPKPT